LIGRRWHAQHIEQRIVCLSPMSLAVMKIFVEGEAIESLCEDDGWVRTTFRYRTFQLAGDAGETNVLVAVCDVCSEIICVPHQSTRGFRLSSADS
jgi:hypothetical protein